MISLGKRYGLYDYEGDGEHDDETIGTEGFEGENLMLTHYVQWNLRGEVGGVGCRTKEETEYG